MTNQSCPANHLFNGMSAPCATDRRVRTDRCNGEREPGPDNDPVKHPDEDPPPVPPDRRPVPPVEEPPGRPGRGPENPPIEDPRPNAPRRL